MNAKQAHKETTAKIRKEIKDNRIKASVSKRAACGQMIIDIAVPKYDVEFTQEEIFFFCTLVKNYGCTFAAHMEIDPEKEMISTGTKQFVYEYHI